jgi:HEAT repeat protein
MLIPVILVAQQNDSIQYIDSLVEVLINERRNWNEASRLLMGAGDAAVGPLLEVITDKSIPEWPRRKVAFTLAEIPSQRVVEPCIHIFQDPEENINLRIDVSKALKGKDISSYENIFLEAAGDQNPFMRLAAIQKIWSIGSFQALKIAYKATQDNHNLIRRGGYEYLSRYEDDSVSQALLNGLFDKDWYVKAFIFTALIKRGETVARSLKKISENPEYGESIRWSALSILRKTDTCQDIEFFLNMLVQPGWMIRNEATLALYERKDSVHLIELISRVGSLDSSQKYSIFWLIGSMAAEGSIPWLEAQLKDPECGWMAAVALGLSHSEQASGPLIEGLKDPDNRKKRACLWALTHIGTGDGNIYIPFLQDNDPELVRLALSGLNQLETSEAREALKDFK